MRKGSQEIILGLRIGDEPEDIGSQIIAHMRKDGTTETSLDVFLALYVMSGWPSADKRFREFIQAFPDLWVSQLNALTIDERFIPSVMTLRALGMPMPDGLDNVIELVRDELARRGIPPVFQ